MAKMNLGSRIDALYEARAARLTRQKEMDAELAKLKKTEADLKLAIIAELEKAGLDKGTGSQATASISITMQPRVTDWEAVYKYIKKNDAFDLLERRPAKLAFRARYEAGDFVPGMEAFEDKDLSLTKAGA